MIRLTLPFPPSANNAYFNARKGRVKTPRYREWAEEAGWEIRRQKPSRVLGHYVLTIDFVENDKIRRDIANFEKCISDLLVEHGLVDDDSMCVKMHLSRSRGGRKQCVVMVEASSEPTAVYTDFG